MNMRQEAAIGLVLFLVGAPPGGGRPAVRDGAKEFHAIEQGLMDAISSGDRAVWNRAMDPECVVTTEDGETLDKKAFLDDLRPLPPGLEGSIAVRELTVREFPAFAVVRYVAEESGTLFGQELDTRYRVTNTYRRDGRLWLLVASHFTVVARDPLPQAAASAAWPGFVGTYRLAPEGWTFHVALSEGRLQGGRDPQKLRPFIPLGPNVFALSGSPGEWIFASDAGKTRLLSYRKFGMLVWTPVDGGEPARSP